MIPIKRLNIPNPCGQDWNQMTATKSGRHCESCAKTVVDFTRMSNDEIVGYLSANHNVCARIGVQQLDSVNLQLVSQRPQNRGSWAKWLMAASLFVATAYSRANAQNAAHPTEQTGGIRPQNQAFPLGKIWIPDSANYRTITGTVVDDTNLPLPGVRVVADGNKSGTQTDDFGRFTIRVPVSAKKLHVSFLGYETTEVKLKKISKAGTIQLKLKPLMMGGIGITKPSLLNRFYARFTQNSVWRLFNREA